MAAYSEDQLVAKLDKLNSSQESIQITAYWFMFHVNQAPLSVGIWQRELAKAPPSRKLSFIYLANEVLQNSRRKGPAFISEYQKILPAVFTSFRFVDKETKKKVHRLLKVWEDRQVYPVAFVKELESCLGMDSLSSELPQSKHLKEKEDSSNERKSNLDQNPRPQQPEIPQSVNKF